MISLDDLIVQEHVCRLYAILYKGLMYRQIMVFMECSGTNFP